MGFVTKLFVRPYRPTLVKLPQGCCTFDSNGSVVCSTMPSAFPRDLIQLIGNDVMVTFKTAAESGIALQELTVSYAALTIRATLRQNGTVVFLSPRHEARSQASPVPQALSSQDPAPRAA